jgi:hypothetical protein
MALEEKSFLKRLYNKHLTISIALYNLESYLTSKLARTSAVTFFSIALVS